ncbi:MAG TPA: FtsX-like permease family protein [Geomonas sp.]
MLNARFVARQITGAKRQSAVFVLCVALSMITLVSLGSFARSVQSSLLRDAQALHAADLIIHAHAPLPGALQARLAALARQKALAIARYYEFYSVVRKASGEGSLLSNLKVVEPGYPFYGKVVLASGRPFGQVLTPGSLVVEQSFLDRLRIRVGDALRVGNATLTVRDVLLQEPDRPVNFFALGPRIFVSAADLASLGLIGTGSRVEYVTLAKVSEPKQVERIASELRLAAAGSRVRVDTYQSADSRVKRFFDNLLFFLNLSGIFTLLLAGFGIQSTLSALLKEQERTIAVMKAIGARSRFIIGHFLAVTLTLGLAGTVAGLLASLALQGFLPVLFRGLIPARVELGISGWAVAEGMLIGLLVVLLFTALPLYRLKEVKPRAIFGKEETGSFWNRSTWVIAGAGTFFFLALVLVRIRDLKTGLYFILALVLLVLAAYLLSVATLSFLRRQSPKNLALRQALKGLFRPRNASRSILVTLSAALAVIFTIMVVEKNLDASFIGSFPPGAPNVFFIDIQPGQKAGFAATVGIKGDYYPVVRGTVNAVNGRPIDPEKERAARGDNLARDFNLTYYDRLLQDERLVAGKTLFRKDWPGQQVSVLDTVLKMHKMALGDTITFRVQGIPIEARIVSVRTRSGGGITPFFYFVFPESVLAGAPQTLFCAARIEKGSIAALQNRVVARFPNVSVIDLTETATVFARIMGRLSVIVRFFTSFSIAAGVLIVVSSVFATRYARIQEAVYFTILGARRRFVLAVFAAESLVLGLASGLIALFIAQVGSLVICRKGLDLSYHPYLGESLLLVLATALLVLLVGMAASVSILRQKPVGFLRGQADE